MKFKDVLALYEEFKKKYGKNASKHISELLAQIKDPYKAEYLHSAKAKALIAKGKTPDAEQSWKSFKGHSLENLVLHIIKDEVKNLGLEIVKGDTLERRKDKNLSPDQKLVRDHIRVDYREFGKHLPDADLIIYRPSDRRVIAVVSTKVTLRERIAQTAYWRTKFHKDERLAHIKAFFVTTDEDKTLSVKSPASKGRAIVESDTDGGYVMSEESVEESEGVKAFDKFIEDLKKF